MPTLYILCGIPGSGKSYWAYDYMYKNVDRDIRYISRDEIRFSIVKEEEDYFSHEKEVFKQFVSLIRQTLIDGLDCIADATHLNEFSRRKLTQAIDMSFTDYEIVYVVFTTNIDTCLERNKDRKGRANVPENVIRNMYRDFRAPSVEEDNRVKEIIEV